MGFAIRVAKTDLLQARAKLDPELAKEVGPDMMMADDVEGKKYIIKNVDTNISYTELVIMIRGSSPCILWPHQKMAKPT